MATKQEKIEAIYEKIANKDLKFWCRVIIETTWLQHSCSSWYDEEYTWIIYEYATWLDNCLGAWKVKEGSLLCPEECYLSSWECYNPDNLDFSDFKYFEWVMSVWESEEKKDTTYLYKIIWHPVMFGDVIDFIKNNNIRFSDLDFDNYFWISKSSQYIFEKLWKKLTAPIEDQSDECIDFVYDLIEE